MQKEIPVGHSPSLRKFLQDLSLRSLQIGDLSLMGLGPKTKLQRAFKYQVFFLTESHIFPLHFVLKY